MQTEKLNFEVVYNGRTIGTDLAEYLRSVEYSDEAEGSSDTLNIVLADCDERWIAAWLPEMGDRISLEISGEGGSGLVSGELTVDDLSYSAASSGTEFKIGAVSKPADDGLSKTIRSKVWENTTLHQIAGDIAKRYNLTPQFLGQDIQLAVKEQDETTDGAFLTEICEDYGRSIKIFAQKLVIFDREALKKEDAAVSIPREEMTSLGWKKGLTGCYTGGTISYTPVGGTEALTYSEGSGKMWLNVNTRADSLEDAKLKLKAAIAAANHGRVTVEFETPGRCDVSAGQNVILLGLGKLSGKFYVDSKVDSLSNGGWVSSFEASKVADDDEVIIDAINRLYGLRVINTPSYWETHFDKVPYLDGLLLNMATVIKQNLGTGLYADASPAIEHLAERGIVNDAAYWQAHKGDLPYLPELLVKAANAE